jgi:hypothetical protein
VCVCVCVAHRHQSRHNKEGNDNDTAERDRAAVSRVQFSLRAITVPVRKQSEEPRVLPTGAGAVSAQAARCMKQKRELSVPC